MLTSFYQKVLVCLRYLFILNPHNNLVNLFAHYKLLFVLGTRLVVSLRGDEPYEDLEILKEIEATMVLHELPYTEDKISRVHAARR